MGGWVPPPLADRPLLLGIEENGCDDVVVTMWVRGCGVFFWGGG